MSEEFFVGYLDDSAPQTRSFVKRVALATLIVGTVLIGMIATNQSTIEAGRRFEFGNVQEFEGVFVATPTPMLVTTERDEVTGQSVFLLVDEWKFGIDAARAQELHLRRVKLRGTRIHAVGSQAMLEADPDSAKVLGDVGVSPLGEPEPLGERTIDGEIVDSKCYLGVMNPGALKTHRACAIHCIRGGIPPILLVRGSGGERQMLLLVDENGGPLNDEILDLVAVPVRVTGDVQRLGDLLVIRAARSSISAID